MAKTRKIKGVRAVAARTSRKELLLKMKDLCVSYGDYEALLCYDLELSPGEIHVIAGESGSGKSTLLRCATMLENMDGGCLSYIGQKAAWEEEKNGSKTLTYADRKSVV